MLNVHSLTKIIPWLFALSSIMEDGRWLTVHIRYMNELELPVKHPEVFQQFSKGYFVVHKTKYAFPSIALDHAHKQANALVKGEWSCWLDPRF